MKWLLVLAGIAAAGNARAMSVGLNFSGQVPAREGNVTETVIVTFGDEVLLPVPKLSRDRETGSITVREIGAAGQGAHLRMGVKGVPPVYLAAPIATAGGRGTGTRYRVCAHSQSGSKKQCRAYRIVPAPGIK